MLLRTAILRAGRLWVKSLHSTTRLAKPIDSYYAKHGVMAAPADALTNTGEEVASRASRS